MNIHERTMPIYAMTLNVIFLAQARQGRVNWYVACPRAYVSDVIVVRWSLGKRYSR